MVDDGTLFRMKRGQAVHARRSIALAAMAGVLAILGACGTPPESADGVLDARLAGPCDRLILSWPENAPRLQTMMSGRFEPSTHDGVGVLRFSVLQCGAPDRRWPPLRFAYLSVPISADSVPLVITRMPDDGWAWLPFIIVDDESAEVFGAMGYEAVPAEIEFSVDSTANSVSIAAHLSFNSGRISITADGTGEARSYTAYTALVSEDARYHSVFFGKETATRRLSVTADISVEGSTPLSVIGEESPEASVFDTELRPDRIYWRLPRAEP